MTDHLVQFSTGAGSAEVALRVYEARQPGDRVVLLTADTKVEDEDNWRFAREIVALMPEAEWVILADGRTPMQVGRDSRIVPNNRMAVCSRVLKRELLWKHMEDHYDPLTSVVYLGFDWTEEHRLNKAAPHWDPWTVDAPLMRAPYLTKSEIIDKHLAFGVEPCRLYAQGFSHANCGGACVRGGQAQWKLLLSVNPERYKEWEDQEEEIRSYLGKDVAIMREQRKNVKYPLPLKKFRERIQQDEQQFDHDDWGACGCFMDEEEPTSEPAPTPVAISPRKTPPTTMSTCGTKEGYMAHQRRKQEACAPCKAAWATYYRDYRAGRKQKKP